MGKPRLPNQRKAYRRLSKRLAGYMMQVRSIYDRLNEKAAAIVESVNYDGSVEFFFADYPELGRDLLLLQRQYVREMQSLIYSGTSAEWINSNMFQNLIASKVLGFYGAQVSGHKFKHYLQTNSELLKAFQVRKDRGLNLSAKLWNQSQVYKDALEAIISTAVEKGMSAITLSKKISQYLKDWPSLQADYQEKYGKVTRRHNCEYRSIRLARNEINIAYRIAEQERWKQFDFILGYKIKLSDSHPKYDICDELVGDYPVEFKFTGWHPNCLCYTVPIVMSEDEYWSDDRNNSPNLVTAPPDNFGKWIDKAENLERIDKANKRGTLPYWLRDNEKIKDCALLMAKARAVGGTIQEQAETIAKKYGGVVTPINYKGFSSMYRKLGSDKDMLVSDIKDSVRNTIIVEKENIGKVVKELQSLPTFSRYKPQAPEDFCGYSGNIINLKMPNGIQAEIQVNTPKMIYAKETEANARRILGDRVWEQIAKETGVQGGLGHKYYEEMRVLDKDKDVMKITELTKLSKSYYAHFQ